jgi:hypothetical protein
MKRNFAYAMGKRAAAKMKKRALLGMALGLGSLGMMAGGRGYLGKGVQGWMGKNLPSWLSGMPAQGAAGAPTAGGPKPPSTPATPATTSTKTSPLMAAKRPMPTATGMPGGGPTGAPGGAAPSVAQWAANTGSAAAGQNTARANPQAIRNTMTQRAMPRAKPIQPTQPAMV